MKKSAKKLISVALALIMALSTLTAAVVSAGAAQSGESAGLGRYTVKRKVTMKLGETRYLGGRQDFAILTGTVVSCEGSAVSYSKSSTGAYVLADSVGTATLMIEVSSYENWNYATSVYIYSITVVDGSSSGGGSSTTPAKPGSPNLSVSVSGTTITATWGKVANAEKYIVYRKKGSETSWTSYTTTSTGVKVTNAAQGTVYHFQVQSVGKNDLKGNYSSVRSVTVLAKPTLTVSNKSNGVRAEWNRISGATKYIVYYKSEYDSNWSSTETLNTYYPLLNTVAGRKYAFQVRPVCSTGNGPFSDVKNIVFTRATNERPNISVSVKSNGIRVEWNSVAGATSYIVYYRRYNDSNWSSVETRNVYYPYLSAVPGTAYCFQVQPVFSGEKGAYSSVKTITYTHATNERPNITVSNKSNGIRVEWNSVSGATSYIVYYRRYNDSGWSSVETRNVYYPYLSAVPGTAYCFQVQPVFNGEKGAYSSVKTITFTTATSEKPVTVVNCRSNGIRVEWDAVAGATSYIVYYREESSDKWLSSETGNTYYPILNVKNGVRYKIQVQAIFNGVGGAYSSVWSITYKAPSSVKTLVSAEKSNSGIRLKWNPVSGATSYRVAYQKESDSDWQYITVNGSTTSYWFPSGNLTRGEYYFFAVYPRTTAFTAEWSLNEMVYFK